MHAGESQITCTGQVQHIASRGMRALCLGQKSPIRLACGRSKHSRLCWNWQAQREGPAVVPLSRSEGCVRLLHLAPHHATRTLATTYTLPLCCKRDPRQIRQWQMLAAPPFWRVRILWNRGKNGNIAQRTRRAVPRRTSGGGLLSLQTPCPRCPLWLIRTPQLPRNWARKLSRNCEKSGRKM